MYMSMFDGLPSCEAVIKPDVEAVRLKISNEAFPNSTYQIPNPVLLWNW